MYILVFLWLITEFISKKYISNFFPQLAGSISIFQMHN